LTIQIPAAANEQALQDLENGATGLTLVMVGSVGANGYGLDASSATLERVLQDVKLDAGITIDFNLSPATRAAVQHFAALVQSQQLPPAAVDMRASINPVGGFAATGKSPQPWTAISKSFADLIGELASQDFRGPFAVADGRIIHNAGGSEAQELAFVVASAVEYLRALEVSGVPLTTARDMIYFRLSADAEEFLTIAKFRALRKLWARIEESCGLAPKPAYVAAETAWRMMTRRDPLREHAADDHRRHCCWCWRRRQHRGVASHRGAGLTRCIRAPYRTQHPAHFARRVEILRGSPILPRAPAPSRI
jgi:methylmalonyl-CoA mutase